MLTSQAMLRLSCCALAAHLIASGAHAAASTNDRLPTQPIHRSILSQRKRTVLRERHAAARNDSGLGSSLRAAKDRRTSEEEGSSVSNSNGSSDDKGENEQQYEHSDDGQYSSDDEPILASPWWVQIHEEFGQNSFNFIPGSRRAASSVMFTYNYDSDNARHLADQQEEIDRVKEDINALVETFGGGVESKNNTDTTDEKEKSNATLVTKEVGHESESNESSIISEPSENGMDTPESTEDAISNNSTENTEGAGSYSYDDAPSDQEIETESNPEGGSPDSSHDSQDDVQSSGYSADQDTGEEYMIISGGYTDHDWKNFPVYAFPITSSIHTLNGEWIDLSPSEMDKSVKSQCNEDDGAAAREQLYTEACYIGDDDDGSEDLWEKAAPCAPSGRMGHQSVIHNGKLYVFGGLIYDEEQAPGGYGRKEAFRLEDVPFVYRLDLVEMFEARRAESGEGGGNDRSIQQQVTGWQRIIPRVKPFSTHEGMSTSASEVLLTSINRGEMQGGLWSSESTGENDKFVMYGGLRIAKLEYDGYGHNGHPSKFVKGENTFGSSQQMHSHKIVELPLGDVWAYDLVLDAWEKITNNYGRGINAPPKDASDNNGNHEKTIEDDPLSGEEDDDWLEDLSADYSLYPRPRTAHAATVVGNELIIHGGMGWNEHTNDWDGSTDWESLDDMWILDLNTRGWTRRWLFPPLVRSYHSLVGWEVDEDMVPPGEELDDVISWEGPVVAAFGGYTTGIDVFSGEEVAYVFDDLLVSYPPPPETNYDNPLSPWLKAATDANRISGAPFISTRYEHSAVLSKEGVLTVWGGSFSGTSDVKGMWMINVAGKDSTVNLSMAEADSIYDDYERTITALHTIVIMLMFMSISLTLLLGLTQRYQELVQQANDDAAMAAGVAFSNQEDGEPPITHRGNGLHPEIIDTIPQKIYSASENNNTQEGEQECCPICLLEYSDGDELRVLPCDHYMHKSCLDAWLVNNPSCPSCRYSLSDLVDDRPMMQLRTLRSRLSNNVALARFLGHEYADSIGGIEMTSPNGAVIDLRYVSSLALSEEEDTESDGRGEGSQRQHSGASEALPDPLTLTAMDELGSWRSRRRQLQRDHRRPRLVSLRHNVSRIRTPRRSRVPLADLDDA